MQTQTGHNTKEQNLRFQIAFTETNIRYLLGEPPVNNELIAKHRATISDCKRQLSADGLTIN